MDTEDNLLILMNSSRQLGLYDTLKKLTEKYAEKIPDFDKRIERQLLYRNYEILLKKVETNFTAIPLDFTDEDILNALYLHLSEYNNDEAVRKLLKKFVTLYKAQKTEVYQNCIGPIIKMIYSIYINQSNVLNRKKCFQRKQEKWFDIDFIPRSLQNFKKYLPEREMKFFQLPKIHSSQSEDNLAIFRPTHLPCSLMFDRIFKEKSIRLRQQNMFCELDEGFVTPSEDHKEKTPYSEQNTSFPPSVCKKFEWDFKVLCVPSSKYKTWEQFGLLGRNPEHHFLPKKINFQNWLCKAPQCFKKVSKEQLISDMTSLLIGIPSTSFTFNGENFCLEPGLYTNDHTAEEVAQMTKKYIETAEAFVALKKLSENTSDGDTVLCAFKLALEQYLYNYQLMVFHLSNINNNNEVWISDVDLLIEQITNLKCLLTHPEELKGVVLLKLLYDNMATTSTQKFYLLSYLFLLPCIYYFRLIDDWIFLSRWHKDLPITPCDITLVQDRESWKEAYKPTQSDVLWFIPVEDLANCGKALSLLSTSKNCEKFLNLLRSDDRPRIKLCLHSHELKELESECRHYYKKAKKTFHTEEHEMLDLALCAEKSATMRAQAFEELKKEKKENELEKKRMELNLREEDLIRSANVKESKKKLEELDNMRVAAELDEIHFREHLQELEKAKKIYVTLKQELVEEEKKDLMAKWKLKREQNNEKRQGYFNKNFFPAENLQKKIEDQTNDSGMEDNLEDKNFVDKTLQALDVNHSENCGDEQVYTDKHNPRNDSHREVSYSNSDCHQTKYSELKKNRLKVLSSNFGIGEPIIPLTEEVNMNRMKGITCEVSEKTEEANSIIVEKHSDLAKNKLKVLNSDIGRGGDIKISIGQEEAEQNKKNVLHSDIGRGDEIKISTGQEEAEQNKKNALHSDIGRGGEIKISIGQEEAEQNKKNALHSDIGRGADIKISTGQEEAEQNKKNVLHSDIGRGGEIKISTGQEEAVQNKKNALHSDIGRGCDIKISIGQEEAEQNKKKMLSTHFILGTDFTNTEKVKARNNIEIPNVNNEYTKDFDDSKTESKLTTCNTVNTSHHSLSLENMHENESSSNVHLASDDGAPDSLSMDKIDDQPEPAKEYSDVNWFHNCNKHLEIFADLFKDSNQILLPEQSFNYYSLLTTLPDSLKVVLDMQVKLVNEAVMEMFLNELKLLDEAGKLKNFFFLHGEFGKRLTSSLCFAIEKEKPSTLLTFGKLRDILSFASQGDEKVSFIVKEIPAAFELTNPQALSCLGMSYKFDWPLNLIFTDVAISKYNDVFDYILSLQRVTWHLEQVWYALKFKSQINGKEYTQIQLYRHVMSQFVSTLQWYIGTTIFDSSWQKFNRDVREVTNLEELYRKHASYIKDIIFKCFLDKKSSGLMKKIQSLLKDIIIFCQVMRFGEWSVSESGDYHHSNFGKLQNTFSCFLKLARYVIRQIKKLVNINYQEGLANLYNILTINSFYLV